MEEVTKRYFGEPHTKQKPTGFNEPPIFFLGGRGVSVEDVVFFVLVISGRCFHFWVGQGGGVTLGSKLRPTKTPSRGRSKQQNVRKFRTNSIVYKSNSNFPKNPETSKLLHVKDPKHPL